MWRIAKIKLINWKDDSGYYKVIKLSMWKTPSKSAATTVPVSEAPGSARSDLFIEQPMLFPNVIEENPEYLRLYEKIYRSQEKAYESIA